MTRSPRVLINDISSGYPCLEDKEIKKPSLFKGDGAKHMVSEVVHRLEPYIIRPPTLLLKMLYRIIIRALNQFLYECANNISNEQFLYHGKGFFW